MMRFSIAEKYTFWGTKLVFVVEIGMRRITIFFFFFWTKNCKRFLIGFFGKGEETTLKMSRSGLLGSLSSFFFGWGSTELKHWLIHRCCKSVDQTNTRTGSPFNSDNIFRHRSVDKALMLVNYLQECGGA